MTWTRATVSPSNAPDATRLRYLLLAEPDATVTAEIHRMWLAEPRTWPVVVARHDPERRWLVDSPGQLRAVMAALSYPDVTDDDVAWVTGAPDRSEPPPGDGAAP